MGCPMGFGELNIPSSRAFWDDAEEDDELSELKPAEKLKLQYASGFPAADLHSNLLLLIESPENISEFAKQTLLKDFVAVCKVPAGKNSTLYFHKDKMMFMAVLSEDLTASGEITELLIPYAEQAQEVITLTIRPKVDYKSENIGKVRDEITFLRAINSKLTSLKVEDLEPPNFIVGVAAGVASFRYNNNKQISTYIAYTDYDELDTLSAQPILKLLSSLNVNCASKYKPKIKDGSHLYM